MTPVEKIRFDDFDRLTLLAKEPFGDWGHERTISQEMVNEFAGLSGDHQWIHVDPVRARDEGPFGAAVAHGMLVLSVIPSILPANNWAIDGHGAALNYGSDGIRFVSPVLVGDRIHARAHLADAAQHPKGSMITIETAVHVVGREKPAMTYRAQVLYLPRAK